MHISQRTLNEAFIAGYENLLNTAPYNQLQENNLNEEALNEFLPLLPIAGRVAGKIAGKALGGLAKKVLPKAANFAGKAIKRMANGALGQQGMSRFGSIANNLVQRFTQVSPQLGNILRGFNLSQINPQQIQGIIQALQNPNSQGGAAAMQLPNGNANNGGLLNTLKQFISNNPTMLQKVIGTLQGLMKESIEVEIRDNQVHLNEAALRAIIKESLRESLTESYV